MEAIHKGMTVYFTSMDRLMADLSKADREERLERRWKVYRRPDILMIDEIGYSRLKPEAGNLFFRLVCMRYEQGSMILTSNKGFGDWGETAG
jgi:DNA replication protein DnaC